MKVVPDSNGAFPLPPLSLADGSNGGSSITVIKPLRMNIHIFYNSSTITRQIWLFKIVISFLDSISSRISEITRARYWSEIKIQAKSSVKWGHWTFLCVWSSRAAGGSGREARLDSLLGIGCARTWQEINDLRTHPLSTITTSRGILTFHFLAPVYWRFNQEETGWSNFNIRRHFILSA